MKNEGFRKFLHEILLYFWIPLIVGLVSYIFFQLKDVVLGLITLVALSACYAIVRLFFTYKKWWLLIILLVVVLGSVGAFFLRAPSTTLSINGEQVNGTNINLTEGTITIIPSPQGNGQYTKNTVVTLTAQPTAGYDWASWTGTDKDNSNPTTVTMTGDKNLQVHFNVRYSLIINNQQVIGSFLNFTEGSVTIDPPPSNADGKYANGTKVTLTVHPNTGYDWQGWVGTDNDNNNPTTVTMNSGRQIMLVFSGRFELSINGQTITSKSLVFPEGTVAISPAPGADGKYATKTTVTLQAYPNSGYNFLGWSGTNNNTTNPTSVTITSEKHVTINWEQRYLVTINSQPMLTSSISFTGGTVSANPAPGSDGSFAKNTRVTFTAVPATGYRFGWWGGEISGTTNSISVVFSSDKNITVVFVKTYNLTTGVSPAQGGSVSSTGGTYDEGTSITLTATPAAGYRFDHWSGSASGTSPSITVIMNADKNLVAVFVKTYTLTVTISPTYSGSVSPSGGTYDEGASVTLTATPVAGYRFDHWSGDASGSTASITFTMSANKNVVAVFVKTFTLTVTISPASGGSVSPGGGVFDTGANVTLTATPTTDYRFDHWEGAASGNATSVTVTMNADKSVTAVFVATKAIDKAANPAAGGTVAISFTTPSGYRLECREGDLTGNAAVAVFIVNDDKSTGAIPFGAA